MLFTQVLSPKLNLKRGGKAATPSKKATTQKLKSRIQDKATNNEGGSSDVEYSIGSNSPTEPQTTQNRTKQTSSVLEPIGIASPPCTTTTPTSPV